MKSWRQLEHTADLMIEGRGDSQAEAVEAVAEGVLAEVGGEAAPLESRTVAYQGGDLEETVLGLLGELLYTVNGEDWLPSGVRVTELTRTSARMELTGEPVDPARHHLSEVKAATFHDFSFTGGDPGWTLRVLFDV